MANPQIELLARRIKALERSRIASKQPQLANSSIVGGAIQGFDVTGQSLQLVVGQQYDGTSAATVVTGPTPPTPTTPFVRQVGIESMVIYWDGTFSDALVAPMDFSHVTVHAVPIAEFSNPDPTDQAFIVGSFHQATGGEISVGLEAGQYVVYFFAWSQAGKFSAPSTATTGTTIVVPAAPPAHDGAVPVPPGGWAATVSPLGVGALQATWPAVPNADIVTYDVYVAEGAISATPSAAQKYGSTTSTTMSMRALPDGTRFVADKDYAVRVIPRDADGPGTISAQGIGQVRQADVDTISSNWVYAGQVEADQLKSGEVRADLSIIGTMRTDVEGGRNVSISNDRGLLVVGPGGTDEDIIAEIPTDPNKNIKMLLDAVTSSLSALGDVSMRTNNNEIAQSGALILRSGTSAPITPVTATPTWAETRWSQNDNFAEWNRSIQISGGYLWEFAWVYGRIFVNQKNVAGTSILANPISIPTQNSTSNLQLFGGVRIGGYAYLLVGDNRRYKDGNQFNIRHFVQKYSLTTGLFVSEWEYGLSHDNATHTLGTPQIGYVADDQIVLMRTNGSGLLYQVQNPDTGAVVVSGQTITSVNLGSLDLGSINYGNFDFGGSSNYFVITTRGRTGSAGDAVVVLQNSAGLPRVSGLEWPVARSEQFAGMTWDPAALEWVHKSISRDIAYRYKGLFWNGSMTQTWRAASTWFDSDTTGGQHETAMGPSTPISIPKRASISIITPPIPTDPNVDNHDDATAVRIYLSQGGTSVDSYFRQASPADGVTSALVHKPVFSNTDGLHPNPLTTGNFPVGTPALLRADNPAFFIDGNGLVKAKELWSNGVPLQTDSSWTPVTNAGGVSNTTQWRVVAGICYVDVNASFAAPGLAVAKTVTAVGGGLPAGVRPTTVRRGIFTSGTTVGRVDINTDGSIVVTGLTGNPTSALGLVSFPAGV